MATHPDFPAHFTNTEYPLYLYTLDDAGLETRCPLDNGRFNATSPSRSTIGKLGQLPDEIITQVLLYTDIPSLTRVRGVNRYAMEFVDSIPQYAAIINHCPNIIRAIVSVQADAFDCATLFSTLSTTKCSTCTQFGYHLYLIDCRRVCYRCYIGRLE